MSRVTSVFEVVRTFVTFLLISSGMKYALTGFGLPKGVSPTAGADLGASRMTFQ